MDETLDRLGASFAGANAYDLFDRGHKYFAVADAPGLGGALDGFDRALEQRIFDHHLELYLGQKIDDVFGAAIQFGMALLAPKALRLDHRDALDADLVQRILHLVELEGLDNRFDLFHGSTLR